MEPLVSFREVTDENRQTICGLAVAPEQLRFVGTVTEALADAADYPSANPWSRAIYHGEQPVGFVLLSWNVEPDPPSIIGPWFLWKLIIDAGQQQRGYGRAAIALIAELLRAEGAQELLTSYVVDVGGPGPFYERLGFRATGERDDNDEVIMALDLA